MEIVRRKYFIETKPIETREKPSGGTNTSWLDLSMRVVDAYTQMPIGTVLHLPDGKGGAEFRANCSFLPLPEGGKANVEAPAGGWGPRFDFAVDAVWSAYSNALPRWTRVKRCLWRWLELGWLVFGAVLGGTAGAVGTLILKQFGAG